MLSSFIVKDIPGFNVDAPNPDGLCQFVFDILIKSLPEAGRKVDSGNIPCPAAPLSIMFNSLFALLISPSLKYLYLIESGASFLTSNILYLFSSVISELFPTFFFSII